MRLGTALRLGSYSRGRGHHRATPDAKAILRQRAFRPYLAWIQAGRSTARTASGRTQARKKLPPKAPPPAVQVDVISIRDPRLPAVYCLRSDCLPTYRGSIDRNSPYKALFGFSYSPKADGQRFSRRDCRLPWSAGDESAEICAHLSTLNDPIKGVLERVYRAGV